MILFVDSENKVRAVNHTEDSTLTPLYVNENDTTYPFDGWSTAKICCYQVSVQDGIVTMMTPYVDSKMLDTIDMMGHQIDSVTPVTRTKTAYIDDTEVVFFDVPNGNYNVTFDKPRLRAVRISFSSSPYATRFHLQEILHTAGSRLSPSSDS